jgi:hypothetical protein
MGHKFEKVIDGLVKYIDGELFPKMNDLQEIFGRIIVGRVSNNASNLKEALLNNEILMTFGIMDRDGTVDVNGLAEDLKKEIERRGSLVVSIPMFGKITFTAHDVDVMRQYIEGGVIYP